MTNRQTDRQTDRQIYKKTTCKWRVRDRSNTGTVIENEFRRRILRRKHRRILREACGCVDQHVGSDRWTDAAKQVLPPG